MQVAQKSLNHFRFFSFCFFFFSPLPYLIKGIIIITQMKKTLILTFLALPTTLQSFPSS